jgi:hypothetical protein
MLPRLPVSLFSIGLLVGGLCFAADQKKPLAIVRSALLEAEDGFARSDAVYQPGETVYLAFNIQGYAADRNSRIKLSYKIDALDSNAVPWVEPETSKIDVELAPQDSKWLPRVRFSPTFPLFAEPGAYKLVIHVTDELAKSEVSQEIPLQVRGRNVPPSPTLVTRNFQFSRQEDGEPLPTAAYRRGDTLWASFDMTGYKTAEKNRVEVQYHLAVLNAENKKIFEQPEPAREIGSTFYPRRYVHAVFNLNLESGIAPGGYTIVLTVRDLLGNQTDESRHAFTIE